MFFWGLFSVVQAFFIFSLLFLTFKKEQNFFLKLILFTPINFLINHLIVILLVAFNFYTTPIMRGLGLIEIGALLFSLWRNASINPFSCRLNKRDMILFITGFIILLANASRYTSYWGNIFNDWDGIMSWNFWATSFANGSWPEDTLGYPQLISTLFSIPYLLIGDTSIQFFSYSLVTIIPLLFLMLPLWWALHDEKNRTFILALLLFLSYIPRKFFELSNGAADGAMFFCGLIFFILLFLEESAVLLILTALAGAFVKAPGMILVLLVPIYLYVSTTKDKREVFDKKFFIYYAFALIALALWFLLQPHHGASGTRTIGNLLTLIKERNYGPFSTLSTHLTLFKLQGFWHYCYQGLLALLSLWGLYVNARIRRIFLLSLPLFVIWAIFASYDTRNFSVGATPLLLFPLAEGLRTLIERIKSSRFFECSLKIPRYFPLASFSMVLIISFLLGFIWTPTKLQALQMTKQDSIGEQSINRVLNEYFAGKKIDGKIMTDYHLLSKTFKYRDVTYCTYTFTAKQISQENIKWILFYHTRAHDKQEVIPLIEAGEFVLVKDMGPISFYEKKN